MSDIIIQLSKILAERKNADPDTSYVARLHHAGLNKILEKIGEESTEAIIAAKDAGIEDTSTHRVEVVKETADLWFHSLVMLSHLEIDAAEVLQELEKRFGTSGLTEKANRTS